MFRQLPAPKSLAKSMNSKEAWKPVAKERWESVEEFLLYLRHLAAYMFAQKHLSNISLLEIGCGTGYGTDHLSQFSESMVAMDIWKEGISNCHARYKKKNLSFILADGLKLPFRDQSFDAAVSFQVIEHIDPKQCLNYLSEVERVLKRKGTFIVTTPNSKLRLLPFQRPWNPQHKKEYDCRELEKLLTKVFPRVELYGLDGTEEIQLIERYRVKQNPIIVYTIAPFMPVIDRLLPSRILFKLRNVIAPSKSKRDMNQFRMKDFVNKFSVNDFKVHSNCTESCIDIYAICMKKASNTTALAD